VSGGEKDQIIGYRLLIGRKSVLLSEWKLNRRQFVLGAGAILSMPIIGCDNNGHQMISDKEPAVTIFENGVILPVDPEFSQHEAISIAGNRILAIGSSEAVRAAAKRVDNIVDLEGRVLLPGFIEPHMHFALMAGLRHWPDIGPFEFETTIEVLEALKRIASDTPADEWVVARQFDPSLQEGPPMLTARELDEVCSDRPVFVLNASGHLAYGNSRLLEFGGVSRDTPDPPGGEYFRYPDGAPNGAMTSVAYLPILMRNERLMAAFGADFVGAGLRIGDEASALGITTLCDQSTGAIAGMGDLSSYRQMADSGRMRSRIRASLYRKRAGEWDKNDVAFGDGDDMLRIVGWKIVTDGSNQGLTGCQREPYIGTDVQGTYYVEPEALKEMVIKRGRQGWPLVLHGNGDAAIDSILDAVQAAADSGIDVRKLRCRIEHCSILHDEQITRIRDLGLGPSFLINHVHYWGHTMRDDVFGPEKVQLLDRCAAVEDAGIKWTIHSDAPVTPLGTLHKIRVAVARDLWKEPDTVLAPQERVSVEAAIRAVTINAAWQCHSENEIGSLAPGKFADFVILEKDLRYVEPTAISDIGITETWMNGERVYKAPIS
jgi:predicted amidohydrolase YtcJ